ncbi:DUF1806 family protein [Paenibacillus koleovorans]|uniref:DUF1806 family protein n=1 Tax=Paenibacillus koleovorans TaxID=121608 RepID=UPI000FDB88E2|nr:DUF1806 family protein [Paenibacillus koleovorans]
MQPIEKNALVQAMAFYNGKQVYVHLEANPGIFLRNVSLVVEQTFVTGFGPYRAAIRTSEGGWIRAEGLTDMDTEVPGRLLIAGHDASGRITAALQIGLKPFDFEKGGEPA